MILSVLDEAGITFFYFTIKGILIPPPIFISFPSSEWPITVEKLNWCEDFLIWTVIACKNHQCIFLKLKFFQQFHQSSNISVHPCYHSCIIFGNLGSFVIWFDSIIIILTEDDTTSIPVKNAINFSISQFYLFFLMNSKLTKSPKHIDFLLLYSLKNILNMYFLKIKFFNPFIQNSDCILIDHCKTGIAITLFL